MSEVLSYIFQYGYLALFMLLALGFLGIPVPDETIVVAIGGLTAEGHFVFWIALLVTFFGSMAGMMLSYTLGRWIGKPLLTRYGKWIFLTPKRLESTEVWFNRYGGWSVLFGYFVPGVRQLTSYLSGVYRLPLKLYLMYAGIGSACWCATFLVIGYTVGHHWRNVAKYVHHHLWITTLILLLIICVSVLVFTGLKRRRNAKKM